MLLVSLSAVAQEAEQSPQEDQAAERESLEPGVPSAVLAQDVRRRATASGVMDDMELKVYGDAAAYGVAEVTTAATFRLGEVYQQFGSDLMESERPKDLDADALEQYDILLEEQAYPFEENAIELFQANTDRAADGVFDEWVQKSFDAMASLMPARYAQIGAQ